MDGQDQAVSAGPFLWLARPQSKVLHTGARAWHARHDGYRRLPDPVTHHRRVELDTHRVTIEDWLECTQPHSVALAFHLGPDLDLELLGAAAQLRWRSGTAQMRLAAGLTWTAHRGELDPPLGWYSEGFGHKTPSWTLIGRGTLPPDTALLTQFTFEATPCPAAS